MEYKVYKRDRPLLVAQIEKYGHVGIVYAKGIDMITQQEFLCWDCGRNQHLQRLGRNSQVS